MAYLGLVGPMPSGVAIGALIGTCFALGWASAGLQGLPSRARGLAFIVVLGISALVAGAVLGRFHSDQAGAAPGSFDGATYGWTITLQSVAIVLTVVALRRADRTDYIMPAVGFIVGAHFFGLARAMVGGGGRVFVWVGTLMCISTVAIILALARSLLSPAQSMALTGFSCAIILWASALSTLM